MVHILWEERFKGHVYHIAQNFWWDIIGKLGKDYQIENSPSYFDTSELKGSLDMVKGARWYG